MPTELRHVVSIPAPPAAVFPYLVEPSQLVRWIGDRARVEAVDGGAYELDINGVLVRGHIIECRPPKRLVIAWGHRDSVELPPGSSTVEIRLRESDDGGTLLEVVHSGLPTTQLDQHGTGWEHFLARLALAAAGDDPGPDPFAPTAG